mgnify:CR=1 FL=1
MELIGRILDGSIPQDLRDALRRAQPSGSRVSSDEKMRHLEDVPLLAECTQKQLRAISDISRVVEVPAGTSLTRAGQPGDEFFVILDGSAAVEKPGRLPLVSAASVNWLMTSASPPVSRSERFIRPSSSSNTRRFLSLWAT